MFSINICTEVLSAKIPEAEDTALARELLCKHVSTAKSRDRR